MPAARDDPAHLGPLGRWGAFFARHFLWVMGVWLVLLVGATVLNSLYGGTYSDNFSLPNTSAQKGADLLSQHDPAVSGSAGQVVFHVASGSLTSEQQAIQQSIANLQKVQHVTLVTNPFSASNLSADGGTAYATVYFNENPATAGASLISDVNNAVKPARQAGVTVTYGGLLGKAAEPKPNERLSEVLGIVVAILALLFVFGSVKGAFLPIVSAIAAVFTGVALLGLVASLTTFATVSPTLALMMGLGVGIDYGLFLTTHFRQRLMDGVAPVLAAGQTTESSGRAVLIAAGTVIIALLGLYASGIGFIGKLGVAAGITVVVAALAALTLVPALLGLAGRAIDRPSVGRPTAEKGPEGGGFWGRWAMLIEHRAWYFLAGGVVILLLLALPLRTMQLGTIQAGANPSSFSDRQAYDQISSAFGPGANGTFTIVVQPAAGDVGNQQAIQSLSSSLQTNLAKVDGVKSVTTPTPTSDGALVVCTVQPTTGPQDAATDAVFNTISNETLPSTLGPYHATGYVTGALAGNLEFQDLVTQRLPVIIAVVVAASFVILLVMFRAPVLAVKAAVMNLLSIGAAYGVVVAVFQWGWGSSLLGVPETLPIQSYVPMIMFAIVFGLSMDYEVFLLARIREDWLRTGDPQGSVAFGLSQTGRVISCAALAMACVFFAFLLDENPIIKMLALGLGVSVLIDATVIRLALVPATMSLLGRICWWVPRWLDAALPHFEPEVAEVD